MSRNTPPIPDPTAVLLDRLWERLHIERDWGGHHRNPHFEDLFLWLVRHLRSALVFEVGAHEAEFSRRIAPDLPDADILALEANPHVWQRFAPTMPERVRYLNLAASTISGTLDLHIPLLHGKDASHSTIASLRHRRSRAARTEMVRCETITLDQLAAQSGNHGPAVLWIDADVMDALADYAARLINETPKPGPLKPARLRPRQSDDAHELTSPASYRESLTAGIDLSTGKASELPRQVDKPAEKSTDWELGLALIEHAQFDQARRHFERLVSLHPERPAGLRGLFRLARAQDDLPAQIRLLRALRQRQAEPERGAETMLRQAMSQGDLNHVLGILGTQPRSSPLYPIAAPWLMRHAHQRHGWSDLYHWTETLPGLEDAITRDGRLFNRYTKGLAACGLGSRLLSILERSLSGDAISLRLKRINVLLLTQQDRDARRGALDVARRHGPVVLSPKLLEFICLDTASETETGSIDDILAQIEAQPISERAALKQRLRAMFIRIHQVSIAGLREGGSWPPQPLGGAIEDQIERILCHQVVGASETMAVFRGLIQRLRALRQDGARFWLDPVYAIDDAIEIAHRLLHAFSGQQGFSLIRLGDGEGSFLPYRPELDKHWSGDQQSRYRDWWGLQPGLAPETGLRLTRGLEEAIQASDLLGIPDLSRVSRDLLSAESLIDLNTVPRGTLAVVDAVFGIHAGSAPMVQPSRMLTSCHLHQALEHWGLWDLLLPHAPVCCLVTCHPALQTLLEQRFAITVRDVLLIPGQARFAQGFGVATHTEEVLAWFDRLQEQIPADTTGEVYLVAAGFLGKLLCTRIKQAGGIALDMGSIVDRWLGFNSRPLEDVFSRRIIERSHYETLASRDHRIAELLS